MAKIIFTGRKLDRYTLRSSSNSSNSSNSNNHHDGTRTNWVSLLAVAVLLVVCAQFDLEPNVAHNEPRLSLVRGAAAFSLDLNMPPPPEEDELGEPDEQDQNMQVDQPQEPTTTPRPGGWLGNKLKTVAQDIRLPQYFNFASFAGQFKRKYNAIETAVRRSIFLQNCIKVFKDRVAYRRGTKSYLTSVNKFSDQTRAEFRRRFMVMPPMEAVQQQVPREQYFKESQRRHEELERQIERERQQFEGPLESVSRCSFEDLSKSNAGDQSVLCKLNDLGDLDSELASELSAIVNGMDSKYASSRDSLALMDELNENQIELESQLSLDAEPDELPWPGQLASNQLTDEQRGQLIASVRNRLDWSRHACFHEIYDQGANCGKCYVMATTTLAEFYKCSEQQAGQPLKRRKFSKDYVLDCAPKFTPNVLGCAGGSPLDTLRFIAHAGIFNIREWRAKRQEAAQLLGLQDKCPLSHPETPFDQWGPTRVTMNPKAIEIEPASFEQTLVLALQDGPLVVSVQMPEEGVESYAGGVHDGQGCLTSGHWHAMLLVGYGQNERGQAYWRFRNSWGADWGDRGHFHLSTATPAGCFASAVRVYREQLGN